MRSKYLASGLWIKIDDILDPILNRFMKNTNQVVVGLGSVDSLS